jgi:hypothetical protein
MFTTYPKELSQMKHVNSTCCFPVCIGGFKKVKKSKAVPLHVMEAHGGEEV